MNFYWQFALIVVGGTAILTAAMMGVILLLIRLQGRHDDGKLSQAEAQSSRPATSQNSVLFELDGKQVAVRIDVHDGVISGLRVRNGHTVVPVAELTTQKP